VGSATIAKCDVCDYRQRCFCYRLLLEHIGDTLGKYSPGRIRKLNVVQLIYDMNVTTNYGMTAQHVGSHNMDS
jgi:hypothetical protein